MYKSIFRFAAIFAALSVTQIAHFANGPADSVEFRVAKMMAATSVPGMSATVIKDGRIVWSKGFGKSDLENNIDVTTNTRFRLASVSKVVTAAAVARLVEKKQLDLDAQISKYVEGLPEAIGTVTARQLAGHLAGVRHYQRKDFVPVSIDSNNYPTVLSSLDIFKDDPLVSPPGAAYKYTTFGFTLLAAVIEGASGKPFLEYLEAEVFEPLRLKSAGPDSRYLVVPNRTSFYISGPNNTTLNASYVNPSYKWAGGGLLMTSGDLARFGAAHLKPGFLLEKTLNEMFISQKTSDGTETGVGITWRIAKGFFGNTIYHHEGSMNGTRSALLIYPDAGVSVAFMTNYSGTPSFAFETAQLIAQPFLDLPEGKPIDPAGIFDVEGKIFGKESKGVLTVRKTSSGYDGAFELGTNRADVIGAIPHEKGHYLIVTHKTGGLDLVPFFGNRNNGQRYDLRYTRKSQ